LSSFAYSRTIAYLVFALCCLCIRLHW